jgi:hypothetical protein
MQLTLARHGRLSLLTAVLVGALAVAGTAGASTPPPPAGLVRSVAADGYRYIGAVPKPNAYIDVLYVFNNPVHHPLVALHMPSATHAYGSALGYRTIRSKREATERTYSQIWGPVRITKIEAWNSYVLLTFTKAKR